jgi:hypothetical protein
LNAIIPKIDPVDYKFFGGKDRFEGMVAEALKHGDSGKAKD